MHNPNYTHFWKTAALLFEHLAESVPHSAEAAKVLAFLDMFVVDWNSSRNCDVVEKLYSHFFSLSLSHDESKGCYLEPKICLVAYDVGI